MVEADSDSKRMDRRVFCSVKELHQFIVGIALSQPASAWVEIDRIDVGAFEVREARGVLCGRYRKEAERHGGEEQGKLFHLRHWVEARRAGVSGA